MLMIKETSSRVRKKGGKRKEEDKGERKGRGKAQWKEENKGQGTEENGMNDRGRGEGGRELGKEGGKGRERK